MADDRDPPADELLWIGAAATLLGVTVPTLRNWDRTGKLIPIRLPSGERRYRRTDIEAILASDSEAVT